MQFAFPVLTPPPVNRHLQRFSGFWAGCNLVIDFSFYMLKGPWLTTNKALTFPPILFVQKSSFFEICNHQGMMLRKLS